MRKIIGLVQMVIFAVIIVASWTAITGLFSGRITWDQFVDSVFTTGTVYWLLAAFVLGIVAVLLDNWLVSLVFGGTLIALVYLVFTGQVNLFDAKNKMDSKVVQRSIQDQARECGYEVSVEKFAGQVRAVLKDPAEGGKILGQVSSHLDQTWKNGVVDENGNYVPIVCKN